MFYPWYLPNHSRHRRVCLGPVPEQRDLRRTAWTATSAPPAPSASPAPTARPRSTSAPPAPASTATAPIRSEDVLVETELEDGNISGEGTKERIGEGRVSRIKRLLGSDAKIAVEVGDSSSIPYLTASPSRLLGAQRACERSKNVDELASSHVFGNRFQSVRGKANEFQLAGYVCTCDSGWEGTLCHLGQDECGSAPCQNNATCGDLVNAFNCTCVLGFEGTLCQNGSDTLCQARRGRGALLNIGQSCVPEIEFNPTTPLQRPTSACRVRV